MTEDTPPPDRFARGFGRSYWLPDPDVRHVDIIGKRWPIVIVDMFERNDLGERRYVETRSFDFNELKEQE
jgi:hypothetical protein